MIVQFNPITTRLDMGDGEPVSRAVLIPEGVDMPGAITPMIYTAGQEATGPGDMELQ